MRSLPGLRMDAAVITRDVPITVDAEGNSIPAVLTIFTGRGTWEEEHGQSGALAEDDSAGRPFATRQATFELRCPVAILEGDLVAVMGSTWSVTAVQKIRTHTRLSLTAPAPAPFI